MPGGDQDLRELIICFLFFFGLGGSQLISRKPGMKAREAKRTRVSGSWGDLASAPPCPVEGNSDVLGFSRRSDTLERKIREAAASCVYNTITKEPEGALLSREVPTTPTETQSTKNT